MIHEGLHKSLFNSTLRTRHCTWIKRGNESLSLSRVSSPEEARSFGTTFIVAKKATCITVGVCSFSIVWVPRGHAMSIGALVTHAPSDRLMETQSHQT